MLIGQTNDVSFRVNVMGTSTEPKVRVLLSTSPELSFPAHKVGDEWKAAVKLPAAVEPGKYDLRVEVILNNRHFTPLTKSVELTAPHREQVVSPAAQVEAPLAPPAAEEIAVVPAEVLKAETPSLLKQLEPVAEAEPPKPKKIKLDASLFKVENLRTPSAPVKVDYQPIISRDPVHTAIDKPLPIVEAVKKTAKKKVLEIKHELPIRLIKGEIVYE